MKKFYFALFFLTAITFAFSQSVGDFRSAGNGNWTNSASWQIWNGTSWIAAPSYPGQLAPPPTPNITIQSGNTITIASNLNTQPLASVTVLGNLILSPPNPANLITLNTPTLNISGGNINFSLVKTRLDLPAGAVITIDNSGSITASTCNNNNEIFIGARKYAACAGAAGGVYTFGEVTTAGGNVNASISNPATGPVSASGCALINIAGGFSGTASGTVTYTWFIRNPNNIISTIGTGTFSANPGTTSPASFTPTISGEYLLSLEVRTGIAPNIFVNVETRIINVSDNTPPTTTCPGNQTGNVDASCDFSIPDYTSLATTGDNCGVASVTQSPIAGTVVGVGTTNIVLTVNDVNGNSVNCNFDVVVTDNVTPTITCAADVAVNVDAGQCYATISLVNPATSDACGINAATLSNDAPATFPVGTTTVTWTVDDNNGNTSTCAQDVVVTDNENPTLTCPGNITVNNDAGDCEAVVTYNVPFADNCPGSTINQTVGLASGAAFPVGTTTNTFVVTDAAGNTATCSFDVTVNDNENPTLTCPGNITVNNDAGDCEAVVTYNVPFADNCPGSTINQTVGLASGAAFPVGTTTNTFVVTDPAGNTATCSFDVTVNDNENPTLTCPGNITVNNDAGDCEAVVTYNVPFADNCPGSTINQTVGLASGAAFPVGTTTNTFVVTDAAGNTATCSFDVTVNDNENPTLTCPGNITVNNDAGDCEAVVTYNVPFADNCPGSTINQTVGLASGAAFPVGTTTNTFVVTDPAGNTATCSFDVTVNDNENPTLTCPGNITVNNDAGDCEAVVTYNVPFADNCPGSTINQTVGLASGAAFPVGTTTNTFVVTDPAGNTATCSFDVTVNDNENPTLTCPGNITVNNDAGDCEAVVTYNVPFADNCPGSTINQTVGLASGAAFPVGTTTNTFVVTDPAGNTATCSFDVTVNDNENPTLTCPGNITVNNDAGDCEAVVTYNVPFADNCPGSTINQTVGLASGAAFPVGTTTNTFVVTDAAGNTASCSFDVTVNDNENPTLTCPGNITVNNDAGDCEAVVTYNVPFADNCPGSTINQTVGLASGAAFPVGTTTNTFVVTDAAGNTATCSFDVTVNDNENPTLTCPGNITVNNDAGDCEAVVTYNVPFADNCPGSTINQTVGLASGAAFPVGTTTNTFVVTDAAGNTATCSFDVTVNDNENPTLTCPGNITVNNDAGDCEAVVTYNVPFADNCPGSTINQTVGLASGAAFPVGTTTNTFVVTDAAGNTATCSFDVTVNDNENPTLTCPGNITVNNDAGDCEAVVTYNVPFADNCPGSTINQTVGLASGAAFPVGTTTNTFVVTDAAGNTATCSFDVTVNDNENPTLTCPGNITVNNDAGDCEAVVTYNVPFADNCPGSTINQTVGLASGAAFPVGTTTNTFVVTDAAGNTATCSFDVTVNDNENPTLTCPGNITVNNDAGDCEAVVTYNVPFADNCPGSTINQTVGLASGAAFPVGTTTNTFVVTDAAGNTATCSFDVTVNDNENPTLTCPGNITVNNDAGDCEAVVTYNVPFADNCPGSTINQTVGLASGAAFPVGTTTNTFVVTDAAGNTATCSFDVTVNDNENPTLTCPGNITVNNDAGDCEAVVTYNVPFADNCPGSTINQTVGLASGAAFPVGTTTNTFVVTDAAGNTATCSFDVTVNDNENPTLTCPGNITVNNDAGDCEAVVTYNVPFADNCPGSTINQTVGLASGAAFPVGTTTNTFVVTDPAGNTATCSFTVTVTDNQPPVLTPAPNQNVNLNASCQIIIPNVRGTATDNCTNPVTITQVPVQGSAVSATHNNPVNVTVTATDATGNTHILTVILTPKDVILPTISCPANISTTNDNGVCGANVTYATPTFNDNCAGASISQTAGLASGSIFPVGTTTNTFVVTDLAGNTRSCSFTVTVTDNQPPVLTPAPNQNVNLNASCQILVPDVRGTATDNCTNPVTITQSPAPNLPVAATHNSPITVTVTATDASGNTDVETVIVTPVDVTSPTISCPGNQSVNFDAGCEYVLTDYTSLGSASDNCDTSISITQSPAAGTILSGATTVTLTATDNAGLTGTCTFQVIPNDITPPNAICNDITVSLGVTGSVNILPTDVDNGSNDACGPVFFSISDSNFTCADIGPNTVTLTVSDNSGNSSSCTATVTVIDDTAPTMQCNDFVVVIDPLTQVATINPSEIDNGSNDACGLSSLTVSPNTFDTSQLGNNTVTLTATDNSGNINTCTAIVTVEPPINEDTILTGTIVDPLEPGENPLPPSALIEATACPGGITAPRDISLNLQASDPNTYNLQASQVIEWQYSQDNGETWNVLPSSAGTLSYTLLDITDDTFVRVRVYDANDPTLEQFSSQVFIRFLPPDEPPILTSDPRFDICLGESVLLTAESFFDQPNGQFGEGGEFNYAQPDGWRVNYVDGDFPAAGDNGREEDWKETNSNNNALFSNINYDTADNTKFALAHGVGNTTQLETPVFSTIGMTSAEAIMTFDTSFFFCNGGYGTIWLSFDSGVTYTSANELTAYWASDDTPINFTTGNNTGLHVTKQGNCNSANSQRASTEPRMTAAYLDLGPYVGLSGLRVRFEFFGSTSTCTNVSFPPAPGNDCDPVRTFDVASGWAIDNVGFAYAGVDDELEWTDEEGNVIAIGTQATVQPITPGIRNYGVTNLVNGCRAPGDDGTNDETLVYTSLAYAGQDYIPAGNQCGENFVQLHAYDNTIKARANYDLGNYEAGLYAVPVDDASDYDPTGVGGQWSIHNPTTTSCGNLATFSSNTDPNATFNASPGNYTLRWTLDDGSGCYDEINVTIVDCPTIDFDGIDDHIDFRNNYNFDSTYAGDGDFSVEVWVKPNSVNGTKTVFARKDDAVNTAGYALTVVDGQVRFNWYKAAGSGSITSGGLSIGTDRWYHLAVTFDGTEYLMYVDGILIATQGGSAPDATPNNIKALIGAIDLAPPNEATKYFHGWMDELRIWTRVLDVQHIRQMMNQEINASGANVMGAVIPTKIYGPDTNADGVEDNPLLWSELEGYYRMNVACGDFSPYKGVAGRLRNIQTSQQETAPLPYTSRASTSWDTDNTWTHHTVWDVPNSNGIDGTPIDWNIVRTTHNISTNSRNLTVLGLLVDQNKLTVTDLADANQDENNPGVGIWVTDYLKLNGEIDLVGESQLVQKRISSRQFNESILDVASAGNLERDQQGTTNLFNYNYFSSPVGAINTSANNVPENLINLLLDGTFTNTTPHPVINWTSSYNATGTTNPITLSNRWIFAYENFPFDNYASWNFKGNTGTLDPGYGFTMKGSGVGVGPEGDIITGGNQLNGIQNYVFKGKPNNEDIIVPITSWYQALVGNPYPSAIDSFEFIDDNVPGGNTGSTASIEGALYFWEHYTSNQTHILEEYEGGYAVLNKIGGVPVYEPALISGDGTPSKTPGQYVPVGQGFFVGSIFNYNGNIKFENDQRVFQREAPGNSVFIRGGVTKTNDKKSNTNNTTSRTIDAVDSQNSELVISRVRLNFKSVIDGKIRPLLLGFTSDNSATDGIDYGYEASNTYFQNNDAFFIIEDGVYVIQGVGEFNEDKIYPLGMFLSENSDVEVSLTDLENFENDIDVFIYDALLGTYTKLNDTNFEANLDPDYYFDRFFVTFKASSTLSDYDIVKDDLVYVAYLEASKDIYIKIPNKIAKEVNLINVLGQTVRTWDSGLEGFYSNAYRIPVSGLPSGTYILKVETDTSTISKKVIIK